MSSELLKIDTVLRLVFCSSAIGFEHSKCCANAPITKAEDGIDLASHAAVLSSISLARRQRLAAGNFVKKRNRVGVARNILDCFLLSFGQKRRGIVGGK